MSNGRPACICDAGEEKRDHLHRLECPVLDAYEERCTCLAGVGRNRNPPHLHKQDCPNYDPSTGPYYNSAHYVRRPPETDEDRCARRYIDALTTKENTPVSTERGDAAQILADAGATIAPSGERGKTYGEASVNFDRIARLWEPVLGVPTGSISAEQVALCMNQVKVSRLVQTPNHRDSWLDGAGYMALGGGIAMIPDRYL